MNSSSDIVLCDRQSLTSQLLYDNVALERNNNDSNLTPQNEACRAWNQILPPQFRLIRYCLCSSTALRYVKCVYVLLILCTAISVSFYFATRSVSPLNTAEIAYVIFQTVVIMLLPVYAAWFLCTTFMDADVLSLLKLASMSDNHLPLKYQLITLINVLLVFASTLCYVLTVPHLRQVDVIVYALLSPGYILPFCYMYTMVLFILEAHRQCTQQFLTMLRSEIDLHMGITSANLRQHYIKLHKHCRHTSLQRGKHILVLVIVALLFLIYAIWTLYEGDLSFVAMLVYVLGSLVTIFEVGMFLASTNEAGYIVCRELSTLLLYHDIESTDREIVLLLQCIHFAKLEIPFFGNFVLRPQTLIAVIGSALGAIIPGFVLRM